MTYTIPCILEPRLSRIYSALLYSFAYEGRSLKSLYGKIWGNLYHVAEVQWKEPDREHYHQFDHNPPWVTALLLLVWGAESAEEHLGIPFSWGELEKEFLSYARGYLDALGIHGEGLRSEMIRSGNMAYSLTTSDAAATDRSYIHTVWSP